MIVEIVLGGAALLVASAALQALFGSKRDRGEPEQRSTPQAREHSAPAPAPVFTRPPPEGDRVRFGYEDREGQQSIRLVTPTQLDFFYTRSGERVIEGFTGYCHDRRATRTFRIAGMANAYVFDTGEILPDAEAIERWLAQELPTPSGRRRRRARSTTPNGVEN